MSCIGDILYDFVCYAGGGGVLNKVLYGEALLRGPAPYPFICHFFALSHLTLSQTQEQLLRIPRLELYISFNS